MNHELSQTLVDLRQTQDELIQKEKPAASVWSRASQYEVNTPIGVALTALTYLEQVYSIDEGISGKTSDREKDGRAHLEDSSEGIAILAKNLQKAAALCAVSNRWLRTNPAMSRSLYMNT